MPPSEHRLTVAMLTLRVGEAAGFSYIHREVDYHRRRPPASQVTNGGGQATTP